MTKDKFLQGCARMRKLRPDGQLLILAGTPEFFNCANFVKSAKSDSTKTVTTESLEKIIQNSVRATKKGLMTYYDRGTDYFSFPLTLKDDFSLGALYASHISYYKDLRAFFDATQENTVLPEKSLKLVDYCKDIGEGTEVHVSKFSQECERELEKEVEEEEEKEVEPMRHEPSRQDEWFFESVFVHPELLFGSVFHPIDFFISSKLSAVSEIKWSEKLFCTKTFGIQYRKETQMPIYPCTCGQLDLCWSSRMAEWFSYHPTSLKIFSHTGGLS